MQVISCRNSTILTIRYLYTAAAVYCSHGIFLSKHLLKRKKEKILAEGCRQQKGNIHCRKYLKFRLIGMFLLVQFSTREIMAERKCQRILRLLQHICTRIITIFLEEGTSLWFSLIGSQEILTGVSSDALLGERVPHAFWKWAWKMQKIK